MKQMVGQLIGPFVPPGFDHVWSNPVPFLVQTVRPRQLSLAAALSPPLGRNTREVLTFIQNPVEIHWNLIESFKIHSKSIENPFKIHSKSIQNPFEIHWHVKSMESTSKIQQNPSWLKCSELFWWDMKKYEKAGGLRQTHFRLWLSLPFDWRKSGRGIESIESSGCR